MMLLMDLRYALIRLWTKYAKQKVLHIIAHSLTNTPLTAAVYLTTTIFKMVKKKIKSDKYGLNTNSFW